MAQESRQTLLYRNSLSLRSRPTAEDIYNNQLSTLSSSTYYAFKPRGGIITDLNKNDDLMTVSVIIMK